MKKRVLIIAFLFSGNLLANTINMRQVSHSVKELIPTCMHSKVEEIHNTNDLIAAEECFIESEDQILMANLSVEDQDNAKNIFESTVDYKVEGSFHPGSKVFFMWRPVWRPAKLDPAYTTDRYLLHTITVDGEVVLKTIGKYILCTESYCKYNFGVRGIQL